MSTVTPGWYKDPAEPTTQRYWDGEGWVGDSLPLEATPPDGPLAARSGDDQDPAVRSTPAPATEAPASAPPASAPPGATPPGSAPPAPVPPGPGVPPSVPPGPSGVPQPGAWPPYPGMFPPGQPMPPGAQRPPAGPYPPGAYPPGTIPPGAFPPGAIPPGAIPPGAIPPGAFPPGSIPGGRLPPNWPPGVPYPGGPYVLRPIPRPHGLALAPLGLRFLARVIDIAAVLLLNVVLNGWLVYQWVQETTPYWKGLWNAAQNKESFNGAMSTRGTTLLIVITLLAIAIWLAYEVPFIGNYGQTLGKRIMGIRVVPLEGLHRIGYGRAIRRWMALGLPMIFWMCNPAFILIGFIFQFMDSISPVINRPLHLALHDRSAGTIVVEAGTHETAVAAKTPARQSETQDGGPR